MHGLIPLKKNDRRYPATLPCSRGPIILSIVVPLPLPILIRIRDVPESISMDREDVAGGVDVAEACSSHQFASCLPQYGNSSTHEDRASRRGWCQDYLPHARA